MDKDEPKQLKLTNRSEGETAREKKGKKEKEPKGNIWVVIIVILITVATSLIFYFSGGSKLRVDSPNLGAPKVYQF